MKELIEKIQSIMFAFEKELLNIQSNHYPHKDFSYLFDLYNDQYNINKRLREMNQDVKKMNISEYDTIIGERKNLMARQKEISENIEKAETIYHSSKKEADKKIEEEQNACRNKYHDTLTHLLKDIEIRIDTFKKQDSISHQQDLENLLTIKTLCEKNLLEIQNKKQQTINVSSMHITNKSERQEQTQEYKNWQSREPAKKAKKRIEMPHYVVTDETSGTPIEKRIYVSTKKVIPINSGKNNPSNHIIDDMKQANYDYKNKIQYDGKKIYVTVMDNCFEIPLFCFYEGRKTLYQKMGIHETFKKVMGTSIR